MLVPVLSALARTSQVKWERATYAFVIIGMVYRAITTYSRGAFLSGGALLVIHLARSKRRLRTICAVVILAAIVVPVLPDAYWKRMDTIAFSEDTLNQEDSSSRGRLHFWRVAVAMANANPVLGVGHNAFNPSYDTYDFLDGLYGRDRAVHSAWFGILAELGYVGAALFVVIVAAALASAIRIRRAAARGQLPPELGIYATALESSFVVYLVGATFLSAQYSEMLWHFIGLSGALSMIASSATTVATKALDAPAQTPASRQVAAAARGVVRAGSQRRFEHRRMPHATNAIRASAGPAPMRLVDRESS
jgi:probable O-glycosylation ligase (exosortase A-associated)